MDLGITLNLPARTVDAVDRNRTRRGGRDTYLHLYEHSLDEYDPEPRKRSGSSCTPAEVVGQTGRPTDDVLVTRLGKQPGFADPGAFTVDPVMGTGTHPHAVLERIAANAAAQDGPGAVSGAVTTGGRTDRRISPGRSPAWSIPLLVPVLPGLLACAAAVVDLRRPDGAPPTG
ncbi:hypothetical protein [Streptomyces sp. BSE7-9]|uniref:hypothetical protein n=1 Tax=Streptomyces sp. BSE7-9 TaxID=2759948 RepID=UPI0018EE867E|nr:hypothetical protein [Streptomyces sp. BSE7-9]MBJ6641980.1 hypothetical protein [Streptomyces sp. BSE7-9]